MAFSISQTDTGDLIIDNTGGTVKIIGSQIELHGGVGQVRLDGNGNLLFVPQATASIGSGTLVPEDVFVGRNLELGGTVKLDGQSTGAGAGAAVMGNAPHGGDPDFWLAVTINGVPGWVPWWHA